MNVKRTFLVSAMGAVAALIPVLMPAGASAATAATAVFSGSMNATVDWVGGGGTFTLGSSGPLGCTAAGVFNGALEAGGCSITASGTFTNIVAGTGLFGGTWTLTNSGWTETYNSDMICVLGQCIWYPGGIIPVPNDPGPSNCKIEGVAQLTANSPQAPNPGAPGFGVATLGFTVSATVTLECT